MNRTSLLRITLFAMLINTSMPVRGSRFSNFSFKERLFLGACATGIALCLGGIVWCKLKLRSLDKQINSDEEKLRQYEIMQMRAEDELKLAHDVMFTTRPKNVSCGAIGPGLPKELNEIVLTYACDDDLMKDIRARSPQESLGDIIYKYPLSSAIKSAKKIGEHLKNLLTILSR